MYQNVRLKSFLAKNIVTSFCLFIALISFKPSEPYLSQYLVCNQSSQEEVCSRASRNRESCESIGSENCRWDVAGSLCEIIPCNDTTSKCDKKQSYCVVDESSQLCANTVCFKKFTDSQVNDNIYPWSTYVYLPFLLILGLTAELIGYRSAILIGISGRIATRFLLLHGTSLVDMQIMQVTYSVGSAAEDIFKAYVYTMVSQDRYQEATSYIATSALLSSILAGIIGDFLVAVNDVSLRVLMIISACSVCLGAIVGFFVILPAPPNQQLKSSRSKMKITATKKRERVRSAYSTISTRIHQLRLVLQDPSMRSLIVWWICGNASYAVIYNYEVSLYKELYGSNNWNGTAVAFILLMGAVGAITPVALGVNRPNPLGSIKSTYQRKGRYLPLPLNHNSTDRTNIDIVRSGIDVHSMEDAENNLTLDTTSKSESEIGNSFLFQNNLQSPKSINQSIEECEMNRNKEIYCLSGNTSLLLLIAGAISIVSLILFLLTWSAIPSIGMLGFFFASWQCISAIILTQLAQYLTSLTDAVRVTRTSDNQMHSKNQQKSKSWVGAENIIVEDVIHNQLNPLYNETKKCQETESRSISDIQIKSHMNINDNDNMNVDTVGVKDLVVNSINSSQSLYEETCKDGMKDEVIVSNFDNSHDIMTDVADVCSKHCEKKINFYTKNEFIKKNNFSFDECEDDYYSTSRGIYTVLESDGIKGPESMNNGMTEEVRKVMDSERNRNSTTLEVKGSFEDDDRDEDGGEDRDRDDEGIRCREVEEEEDAMMTSPFSLAIVAIVGMSVLLQGFLQGLFFTYFGLPLRSAFSILLIIYVLSTLLFVLGCVARVRGQESGVL